jgi:ABC-type antimicrobial peptide transport system ATPase subunit
MDTEGEQMKRLQDKVALLAWVKLQQHILAGHTAEQALSMVAVEMIQRGCPSLVVYDELAALQPEVTSELIEVKS